MFYLILIVTTFDITKYMLHITLRVHIISTHYITRQVLDKILNCFHIMYDMIT